MFLAGSLVLMMMIAKMMVESMDNGVSPTPPMGWLSWQRYGCRTDCGRNPDNCLNDNLIRRQARGLVRLGLMDAGYNYIIIDDCWSERKRDSETGELVADKTRFPNGIRDLVDYVHSLGLKFGIYADYGNFTCAGYPGSLGNVRKDILTFAKKWKVDYVKMDGCFADPSIFDEGFPRISRELNATNRSIHFSCSWPAYQTDPDYEKISRFCNSWRNFDDIASRWDSVLRIKEFYADNHGVFSKFQGPGAWNDPDMLLIGTGSLTYAQELHQMAIWALMAAPLIMSNDLDDIGLDSIRVLTNPGLLAINQDVLGDMGKRILVAEHHEIWTKKLYCSGVVDQTKMAVLLARTDGGDVPKKICAKLVDLGLGGHFAWKITDLFKANAAAAAASLMPYTETYCATVDPFGVAGFIADSELD